MTGRPAGLPGTQTCAILKAQTPEPRHHSQKTALPDSRSQATLAFAEQLAPAVRDIARQVEIHGRLVRTRLAPVLAALALGVALGIGSAVLWMR